MKPENFKEEMKQLGIRQSEMSFELGISESLLNKIVNGWRTPSGELHKKMISYLQKRREQLVRRIKSQSSK